MMTKVRKTTSAVLVLLLAVTLGVGLASCGSKDTEPAYGYGEEGTYYSETSEGEYLLTLREGTFVLSLEDGTGTSGTYEYSEGSLSLTYYGEDEATEASYSEGVIRLTWSGRTVTFLRREYYTVSFMDGNTTLTTQSVLNGKAATDPGDAEKDGYVFLGWYADSAYTTKYEFNTSITANTTIYARFVESSGTTEYKITFDYTGETTETINGVVYNLPEPEREGYTFIGWWVSATNSADELTYKYDGETLYEDTTLFAVWADGTYIGASAYGDKVTWLSNAGSTTDITVTDESGTQIESATAQSASGEFAIGLSSLTAGKYTIEVVSGGVTETLVYVSGGLARVSGYEVVSGSILMYSAVANAERYYISVDCGNASHDNGYINNGKALYYDFSNCDMPAEGITFTVVAYADGYYYSVSSYNYFLGLEKTSVYVENGEIRWERVSLAIEYEIYIDGILVATTTGTSWSLSEYGTGTYEISVRPVTSGYYSEASEAISFTKTTLASPSVTGIADYTITWTEVEGATGYIVSINGIETTISGGSITSLILSDENYTEGLDEYEISVKAMAEDSSNDSPYGESITVTGTSVGSAVFYNNGTVTWQYSLSASEYRITVNDGDETIVSGTNSSPVTLTKSGNNEITIYFINDDNEIYGQASITVYAYAIVFDARGGAAYMDGEEIDTIYVAKGDTVTLPDADYTSGAADFIGWYTLPDTEIDPDKEAYEGDGVLFADGTVFTGNSTIVLYAFWVNQRLTITLDPGMGTLTDEDGNAIENTLIPINGSRFTIAVPECDDGAYVFLGWYSGESGTGKRYTYEDGSASATFDDTRTVTLYAYWAKIFTFSTTVYDGETVLSVEKGADINDVTEATIPETYTINGVEYPVKYIGNSAFSSCPNLEILNIPDTVTYIQITNNGYSSGSGAFASSANITEVNVYATGEPSTTREIVYYSNGGALFDKNSISGNIELVYYPYGRTEEVYAVPSTVQNENEYELSGLTEVPVVRDVTEIGSYVFGMRLSLKKVIFPETVTTLDSCIFYNTSNLESVEFEGEITSIPDDMFYGCSAFTGIDIPDSVTEIGNRVFYACTSLTEIYIPDSVTTLGTNIFYNCYALESVRLSESITEIGNYDFYNCQSLKGIEIPYGVTTIGERAFYGCYVLTRAYLPASLTTINSYAFYYCYMLSDVVLPQSLTTINSSAFYACYSITTITIPSSVTTIGNYAFQNCVRLLEVCNESSLSITIGSTSNGYVAYYAMNLYTPSEGETRISTSDGFSFIYDEDGNYVLFDYDNSSPTAVLPDDFDGNPYDVYQYSFYGCDKLVSLTIPNSITSIGSYAFYNCTALEEIYFDANVSDFGSSNYIFYNAGIDGDGIDVTIGRDVTAVPSYMFYPRNATDGMPNVGSLTFEEGSVCETIGANAFYGAGIKSISLPDSVKKIGDYAFYGCESLTCADLGEGVEEIGNYVFYNCYALEEISWGDDLKSIGSAAFRNCTSLKEVAIPENAESIDDYCFYGCTSLTSVTVPASVKSVGDYAFDGCVKLESVTLEEGVETLGDYCFYGCTSLATIELPSGIISIGNDAFVNTAYYDDEDNWEGDSLYMNTYLIRVRNTADGAYAVKGGTTILAGYAFSGCTLLTKITLPESLVSIGKYAFYNCSSLADLNIPESVTLIESYAFDNCTSLAAITLPAGITEISAGLFYYCTALRDLVIPDGVTEIGGYAFYYCQSLVAMTIPDGVTSIGTYAFYGCSSMVELTIGAGVKTIATYAFNQTTGLERIYYNAAEADALASYNGTFYNSGRNGGGITVYVGKDVTEIPAYLFYPNSSVTYAPKITSVVFEDGSVCEEIGDYAFDLCASLVTIDIPDSVTRIGASAFYACYSLTNITIPSGVTEIGSSAFYNCYKLVEVYNKSSLSITAGSSSNGYVAYYALNVYTPTEGESHMFNQDGYIFAYDDSGTYYFIGYSGEGGDLVLPGSADGRAYEIYDYAFYYSSTVTSIVIPDSVTAIGERAFYYCDTITSVTIGNGVTSIPDYTFYYASNLTEVTLGSGITSIGGYAFYWCNRLQGIDLPDGVTEVGQYAFYYCYGMEYATLGSSLTSIGQYGFYDCYGLESITFPEGLLTIGDRAFRDCSGLREINFCSTITTLGQYAFYGCKSVRNVEIPSSLTSIGNYAFQNCYQLSYATVPDGVTTIPTSCFQNCYSLKRVTIGKDVTTISSNAFYNCYSLVEILNTSSMTLTAGESGNGYVAYYAINVYTPTSGLSVIFDEGDYTFFMDGDDCYLLGYSGYETDLVLPDTVNGGVYGIYGYAFYGMEDITSVWMPDGVSGLGDYCFYGCASLVSVNIPGGVINQYAFQNDTSLRYVEISEGVTYIDRYAFSSCSQLESITIPSTVTYIGTYAFGSCSDLTSLTLNEGLLTIDSNAFYNCKGITSVTIPDSVTTMNGSVFSGCSGLEEAVVGRGLTALPNNAFYNCSSLRTVTIGRAVTTIGTNVFYNCYLLEEIYYNATTVMDLSTYNYVFQNAGRDTDGITLYIAANVLSIPAYLFNPNSSASNAPKITTVIFEEGALLQEIGEGAFQCCTQIESVFFSDSESTWKLVDVGEDNDGLTSARIYFYSASKKSGCWHYGDDGEIELW